MVKTKLPCPPGAMQRISPRRCRRPSPPGPGVRFNPADGLRVDLPEGWVCVRASNTEPILRILAEAADRGGAQGLADEVGRIVQAAIG